MGNVAEIWSPRTLKRGMQRHWVGLGEDMLISGTHQTQFGQLSINRPTAGGRLFATLTLDDKRLTEEIFRSGDLVIQIRDLKLIVAVRAIEGSRVLVEFGVPQGDTTRVALWA